MDAHRATTIDLSSPQARADPYPAYAALRREQPVYRDAKRNVLIVSRYADVVRVLRDADGFSTRLASFETTLLGAEPQAHARVRRIVGRAFAAARVKKLTALVEARASDLVERLVGRDGCDLIGALARPLPLLVVAALLGLDQARLPDLARWSRAVLSRRNRSTAAAAAKEIRSAREFFASHIAALGRGRGDEHVAPFFAKPAPDEGLTIDELVDVAMLLIVAGTVTTQSLIGSSLLMLVQDQACQARLRVDAQAIPLYVEEMLRHESSVQRVVRVATKATDIAGVPIPQGAVVEVIIGSANHDAEKFADGDEFRLGREPNEHIAFGSGRHFCLGAQLARLEAGILLETVLRRLPVMTRADPRQPIAFGSIPAVRGPDRLNVFFRAQA